MTNRPVYRYPPRSHASSCRCERCLPFRSSPGGGWGIIVPAFLLFLAGFWPFIVWHGCKYGGGSGLSGCGASSDWVWNGQTWVAQGIWWAVIAAIGLLAYGAAAQKHPRPPRQARPPKGRLRVEATAPPTMPPAGPPPRPKRLPSSLPVSPQPPSCQHLNAAPVDLYTGERVAWLCPECSEGLPAEFGRLARPCCGTPPGIRHAYNCPQRA